MVRATGRCRSWRSRRCTARRSRSWSPMPAIPSCLAPTTCSGTADYPGFVRGGMEAARPGAVVCSSRAAQAIQHGPRRGRLLQHGGHAAAHLRGGKAGRRSHRGERCRGAVAAAGGTDGGGGPILNLPVWRHPGPEPADQAREWRDRLDRCEAGEAALLREWIRWAQLVAPLPLDPVRVRVTVLDWLGLKIVALPGEPFCSTGLDIRGAIEDPSLTLGYAESCQGYIPPPEEYARGGYEVHEATDTMGSLHPSLRAAPSGWPTLRWQLSTIGGHLPEAADPPDARGMSRRVVRFDPDRLQGRLPF